jgi:hypothetical protein
VSPISVTLFLSSAYAFFLAARLGGFGGAGWHSGHV